MSDILEVPIVNLKELWANKQDLSDEELINIFKEKTSDSKYLKGFVIDGLDAFQKIHPKMSSLLSTFETKKHT